MSSTLISGDPWLHFCNIPWRNGATCIYQFSTFCRPPDHRRWALCIPIAASDSAMMLMYILLILIIYYFDFDYHFSWSTRSLNQGIHSLKASMLPLCQHDQGMRDISPFYCRISNLFCTGKKVPTQFGFEPGTHTSELVNLTPVPRWLKVEWCFYTYICIYIHLLDMKVISLLSWQLPAHVSSILSQPVHWAAPPIGVANSANRQTANGIFWPFYIYKVAADWSVLLIVVIGDHCFACGFKFLRMHLQTYKYYIYIHRLLHNLSFYVKSLCHFWTS